MKSSGHQLGLRAKSGFARWDWLLPGLFLVVLGAGPSQAMADALGDQGGRSGALSGGDDHASSEQARQAPRWSVSLAAIALKRSNGSAGQALTNTVPPESHYSQTASPSRATEIFNDGQFDQGFQVGPQITLNYRDESGAGLELSYFKVLDLSDTQTAGPNGSWLTMYAPGVFWQTQDYPNQGFAWTSASSLYSAEANAKAEIGKNLRLLAGFRWVRLNDALTGGVSPADQYLPNWKTTAACHPDPSFHELQNCPADRIATSSASDFSTFWTTSTTNKLFGLQVGAEGDVLNIGDLSLGGALKAGIYNNRATQNGGVSMAKEFYYASASGNRAAYVGEAAVRVTYRLSHALAIRMGYEFLWLANVALAPGQIAQTQATSPKSLVATGVNSGSHVLFQGGTLGLEYAF